jgi:hypothetical protein
MGHSKLPIRAFGLTVMAALGLMAFTAVAAQAENLTDGGKAGLFQILENSALVKGATLTGKSEGHIRILEPGRNLTILCGKLDFLEGKFLSDQEALVVILYLECVALIFSNETEKVPGCNLVGGDITTVLRALAKKHEGKSYILLEGDPTTIGTIEYESGKGCPLPLKNTVLGSVVGEVKTVEGGQLLQFNEAIQKLFPGDKINYGTFELILDASIVLELTGTHAGCSWAII